MPLLRAWQSSAGHPFEFYTEASINLASDPRLLADMVDAGFTSVFVGVETPSKEALAQTGKLQNLRVDLSDAIERITRAGLEVMGGFIVGFDTDRADIFSSQRAFLERQPIPLAMVGILMALPGTALWRRLEGEGRLRSLPSGDQFSRPNFAPAMEERALLEGYAGFMSWLYSPEAYYARCAAHLRLVGAGPETRSSTLGELGMLLRALWFVGVLSPRRVRFWGLLRQAMSLGRGHVRRAMAHAVQGEHLISYTQEHLLPRMQLALAHVGPVIASDPRPSEPALSPSAAPALA